MQAQAVTSRIIELSSAVVFEKLAALPDMVFLDSAASARYSLIACYPLASMTTLSEWQHYARDHLFAETPTIEGADTDWPFCGGWIGMLAYEAYTSYVPQVPARATTASPVYFHFYDTFLLFDHDKNEAFIASLGLREPHGSSDTELAHAKIDKVLSILEQTPRKACSGAADLALRMEISRNRYSKDLQRIADYIRAGDCYQVNYTQRFKGRTSYPASILYRRLRSLSPAPMSAYIGWREFQVLSASPETFLTVDNGWIRSCPIKGTRPRGRTRSEDAMLRAELMASQKDRAELLMITDLERNDLGRVCEAGSIQANPVFALQSLAQVHHLYSEVRGYLRPAVSLDEILRACFPGGSITGAPKIRAMQIIHELESHIRSVYTGALGYISLNGKLAFNIPIRTLIYQDGLITTYAGSGVVADSDPDAEYEECWIKLAGIREALRVEPAEAILERAHG